MMNTDTVGTTKSVDSLREHLSTDQHTSLTTDHTFESEAVLSMSSLGSSHFSKDYNSHKYSWYKHLAAVTSAPVSPSQRRHQTGVLSNHQHKNPRTLGGDRTMGASADSSKYLLEKEVIASQLRKVQVENSTLQLENKLLKEKVNRTKVSSSTGVNAEISLSAGTRSQSGTELIELRKRIATNTQELDSLKDENTMLREQLERMRCSTDSVCCKQPEQSQIINSYKVEASCLKDELRQARRLLAESEVMREDEAKKRCEASLQVVRLTEVKALLQQQLEQTGTESVAERQVKSLERRLKITEERLHQERTDRANKLSDVEEKLISDNARLQVAEKELKRQLTREREKHRTTEQKFSEMRDENERLRAQRGAIHMESENLDLAKLRTSQRKHTDDLKRIMEQIKKIDNLGPGQEHDMIWLLWQRNAALTAQLKEWEIALKEVKVDHGNVTHGLKLIRDERGMFEDRIMRYKDTLEDVSKEKDDIENILRGKIKDLTQSYHSAVATTRNLEDAAAAISAENTCLRSQLKMSPHPTTDKSSYATSQPVTEAQLELLHSQLLTAKGDSARHLRSEQLLESELLSLRTQLAAKDVALDEAVKELDHAHAGHLNVEDLLKLKQTQIERLTIEVRDLKKDVSVWKNKVNACHTNATESQYDRIDLERQLTEKESVELQLSIHYNQCQADLQQSKDQLAESHKHARQLEQQMDLMKAQLREKMRLLERMASVEGEKLTQIKVLHEKLNSANTELSSKSKQLTEARTSGDLIKQQLTELKKEVEGLRHNQIATTIEKEHRNITNLKTQLKREEDIVKALQEQTTRQHLEMENYRTVLAENRITIEHCKKDKQMLYKDIQDLCQQLTEKEKTMACLQAKCAQAFDRAQYEFGTEKSHMDKEHRTIELDLVKAKEALAVERHWRQDAEEKGKHQEVQLSEARLVLSNHQVDTCYKDDQLKHLQESLERSNAQVTCLEEVLQTRHLEKNVEELREQLHEEVTTRKLCAQRNDAQQAENEQLVEKLNETDGRYLELQATVMKMEVELNLERVKTQRLKQEFDDEKSTSSNVEAHAHTLHTQVIELQAEVNSLWLQLETQKQNLEGRNQRLVLDLKQQTEDFDKAKDKLMQQYQQVVADLDSAHKQIASKNSEQLHLREQLITLEEQFKEATFGIKHMSEALRIEEQHRHKLEIRNQELEAKLSSRIDADSDASNLEATRAEVSKRMSEMEKKVTEQVLNNNADKEAVARVHKQLEECKKKVAMLESSLNQEQMMHMVTKTQLASVDEDNRRVRQQLQAARKRSLLALDNGPCHKGTSRMEEINKIIARSQTQAQQMMASGMLHGDDIMWPGANKLMGSEDISRDVSHNISKGTLNVTIAEGPADAPKHQ